LTSNNEIVILKSAKYKMYKLEYKSNGILYAYISGHEQETLETLKTVVEIANKLLEFKKTPMFFKHEDFALPSAEIRKYWAKKESNPYCLAEVYIVKSTAFRIIAEFYMKLNKPERPTKLFTSEKEAEIWLSSFI
jgi:hypothetical protein